METGNLGNWYLHINAGTIENIFKRRRITYNSLGAVKTSSPTLYFTNVFLNPLPTLKSKSHIMKYET